MQTASERDSSDRCGEVLGGRYRLLKIVGRGGQGVVYEARDMRDGDLVAIKVLSDELTADPDVRERMFREAQALTQLTGTAAVRVMDQVWASNGALGLVMELLEGEELEDYLRRADAAGIKIPVDFVLRVMDPVASTLRKAHSLGIVHRDLKPGNIYLLSEARGGGVRVLDFGFAKFVRLRGFTAAGLIAGSPKYIAPESWRGEAVDERADVYAFGAIVFRCLAGRPPFYAANLGHLLLEVTSAPRPSLFALRPDLPREIDDWVQQVLSIDPADRFLGPVPALRALQSVLGSV